MKKLQCLMTFLFLLHSFFMVCSMAAAEPEPKAAAVRGSSSASNKEKSPYPSVNKNKQTSAAEKNSERGKKGAPVDDRWVKNGRKCYHLRVQMQAVLDKLRRTTAEACQRDCKNEIKTRAIDIHRAFTTNHSPDRCYVSRPCMTLRAIRVMAPTCSAKQAMANPVCLLAECLCSVTVNIWRIKPFGTGDDDWIAEAQLTSDRQPGVRSVPNCHPKKVLSNRAFHAHRWETRKDPSSAVVSTNLSCDDLSPEEQRCDCKGNSDGTCQTVDLFEASECAESDGTCQCAARDSQHLAGTEDVSSTVGAAAVDESTVVEDLYLEIQRYLDDDE
ncbi:hypothetical protein BCR37DRAFT_254919 [Protomyces lactucae-debilis]|uniref:Extracellular membrane protein CFEM domain-containing protein n=1 Tax=Protomyces lactucae-debilis TaxID=2754530 RepID=A0A1Y2FLT6_PROLT|nr:uncharacterized protein BCR37DRAFT_254919 [Protomyces lactucae-debilis]ORY84930.1 hypothetical protein BCR37DRAFT_254919 [Protomyces lactucae-debilis]